MYLNFKMFQHTTFVTFSARSSTRIFDTTVAEKFPRCHHISPSLLLLTVFICSCNISKLPTESCSSIPCSSPFIMTSVRMPCLISCFTWTSIPVSLTKGTPAALSLSEKPENFLPCFKVLASFEVFTVLVLKIQVLWDMRLSFGE